MENGKWKVDIKKAGWVFNSTAAFVLFLFSVFFISPVQAQIISANQVKTDVAKLLKTTTKK